MKKAVLLFLKKQAYKQAKDAFEKTIQTYKFV